ncbi:MAG: hypothetical protein KUG53_00260, partial [Pseudomonadales bacterium]|nr:hypothetical protein [Pseudomonadales bacterium]
MNSESAQLHKALKVVRRRMAMVQLCDRCTYYCWLLSSLLLILSVVDRYGYEITPKAALISLSIIFTSWLLILVLEYLRSLPNISRAALELDNRSQASSLFISAWERCNTPKPSPLDRLLVSQSANKLSNSQLSLKRLLPVTLPQSVAYPLIIALIPLYQLLANNHNSITPHMPGDQTNLVTKKVRRIEADNVLNDPASLLRNQLEKLQADSAIKPEPKTEQLLDNRPELSESSEHQTDSGKPSDKQLTTSSAHPQGKLPAGSGLDQASGQQAGDSLAQGHTRTSAPNSVPINGTVVEMDMQRAGTESKASQTGEFEKDSSIVPLPLSEPSPYQAGGLAFHALLQHYSLSERQTIRR